MKKIIRLGTRGSPLALIQAEVVRKALLAAHPHLGGDTDIEIVPIRTSGDWRPEHKEQRFIELGGSKGLFTKEIEEALLTNYIDAAVHSMKDVASTLSDELTIGAVLRRADPRDAFISPKAPTLADLPAGSVVGTASLRRQAQILAQRPDLKVEPLRGNVETRLQKLGEGMADATLLAVAGLNRISMENRISSILSPQQMLPAAAQGALGIEMRKSDEDMMELLRPLSDAPTFACVMAERAVMEAVDGSCHTPAGAYATLEGGVLTLEAMVSRANGHDMLRERRSGPVADAARIGKDLGDFLRGNSPADIFAA